jgi:hypothetical protein
MKRLTRIAAILALVFLVVVGGSAALIAFNQERVVTYVLASVRKRTGVDIIPRTSSAHLGPHLIVVLDEPQVVADGREIVRLKSLRVTISYHSIFTSTGLPLYSLSARDPEITLPVPSSDVGAVPVPRPAPQTIDTLREALRILGRIAWRVETTEGTVRYADGRPLLDHLSVVAFRTHRSPNLWRFAFETVVNNAGLDGTHVSGRFSVGSDGGAPAGEFAHGEVWTWGVPPTGVAAGGFTLVGDVEGAFKFAIHDDGSLTGAADAGSKNLMLKSARLSVPIALGDYSLHAALNLSEGKYAVTDLTLRRVDVPVISAETELSAPESAAPQLGIQVGGFRFDAAPIKQKILSLRHLPADVVDLLNRIRPGQVSVGGATLSAELEKIRTAPLDAIRQNLVVSASIQNAGFTLPDETKLPAVEYLSAQLSYEKGVLTISQGTARIGASVVRTIDARANFTRGIEGAEYVVKVDVDADLGELYPAIIRTLGIYQLKEYERLQRLGGRVDIATTASGKVSVAQFVPPADYEVRADANGAVITVKGSPGPIEIRRGTVAITPSTIKFNRIMMAATGGDATLDGTLAFVRDGIAVSNLTLDLHDFPSELWLALVVDPSDLGVKGRVGGKVVLNRQPKDPDLVLPEGKLTLAKGEVQFNFLRSPLLVQGATLTMHRRSLTLNMPGSRLEDQAIDFRIGMPDVRHPTIRIDANAQYLDLEVMRFVRMPWSPAARPINFPILASGHIESRAGNLGKFAMTDMKTDFTRSPTGDWRVYNLSAVAYRGKMKLELIGRAPDNWIQMKGTVADMDPAPLFMLGGKNKVSPLLGHLFAGVDLWANTDTNFFETLAGDISITVRDGTLNKFTLLSRLLALIDVKNWLSAQIPDPRINGVPFKTLITDFKGADGLFYTDNFALQGPVMDITASGSLQFGESALDMEVGMAPFDTVDWVLNKIPLIGERVGAGTGKLVAAYFQVRGPVGDPSIVPKPITSVAEFVKKFLGMPINIIRPNTIK